MDTLCIERGQWVPLRITFWVDPEKSQPVCLDGASVVVADASRPELRDLVPSLTDAPMGLVDLTIPQSVSEVLHTGRVNWFKLEARFEHTNILTPRIWIRAND